MDKVELIIPIVILKDDYNRYEEICNVLGFDTIEDKIIADATELMNKMLEFCS